MEVQLKEKSNEFESREIDFSVLSGNSKKER